MHGAQLRCECMLRASLRILRTIPIECGCGTVESIGLHIIQRPVVIVYHPAKVQQSSQRGIGTRSIHQIRIPLKQKIVCSVFRTSLYTSDRHP